jgi:dipeptidyl aminopeptidase/acylaminoacyl peptidase
MPGSCAVASVDVDSNFAPAGPARTLTSQAVDAAGMAWSRDGKSILFVGEGSTSASPLRLWVDGTRKPETVELAGGHVEHPATAGSRDRLVFSRYDWDSHLYRFAPGRPRERVGASSSFEGDPHFSPDGRRIAFTSRRSGKVAIWVAAADGSEPRQFTTHQWIWQGSPNWSPDGRTIAFDAHDPDEHVHVWTTPRKAARHGESRSRRAIRPRRHGLATGSGSTFRRRVRAAATSGASPQPADRRSNLPKPAPGFSHMRPLTERVCSISRNTAIRRS